LWDNPKGAMNLFVRQLRIQELKNVSEVQSLLLILNSLISFSAQFNQHEVGKSLQEVKELVYQQF
jgi:hypothetical protein